MIGSELESKATTSGLSARLTDQISRPVKVVCISCSGYLVLLAAPCACPLQLARRTREPPPPSPVSRQTPVERWFPVSLNQFMPSDTRTFLMRFFYNDEFPGPNIVIEAGGEWKTTVAWAMGGMPYEIAKQLKAGLFYTEHRYYGLTRPFNNTELWNLRYLSVDQALADLAQFIQYVKSDAFEKGRYKSGKVVLVGCSYGGTMATFMRVAYPHLVDAAYSDSGPVLAQEDFPEYFEVVARVIKAEGGEACYSSIEEAMKQLVDLLATQGGPAKVSEMFKTCTTIQAGNPLDLTKFLGVVSDCLSVLIQHARSPREIRAACAELTSTNFSSPVQRLANWITSLDDQQPCIDPSYANEVAYFRNTSYDMDDYAMRLWSYQTCVEFGWFMTTASSKQPFLSTVPLEYYHQYCKDYFSKDINEESLRRGIKRTNIMFGGLHRPDHVISIAGALDPWSPMAPKATHAHHKSPVYVVPGVSHCKVFYSDEDDDSDELRAARKAILNFMYESVVGPIPMGGATKTDATLVLLVSALVVLI